MPNLQIIPLDYYIIFCSALFAIGVVGVLVKRNALVHLHVDRADAELGQPASGCVFGLPERSCRTDIRLLHHGGSCS